MGLVEGFACALIAVPGCGNGTDCTRVESTVMCASGSTRDICSSGGFTGNDLADVEVVEAGAEGIAEDGPFALALDAAGGKTIG